jgi:hypothetical protein
MVLSFGAGQGRQVTGEVAARWALIGNQTRVGFSGAILTTSSLGATPCHDDPIRAALAQSIIALAQAGERDPALEAISQAILSGAKVVEVRGLFPGAVGQGLRRPNDFTFCRPHASRGLVAYLALAGTLFDQTHYEAPR